MRILILFLFILLACPFCFSQGNTTSEYYQYQRDQAFKKYMETTGTATSGGSIKTSDRSIDKNALKELTDMWDRRAGRKTPEQLEKERADRQKALEVKRQQEAGDNYTRQQQMIEAKGRKAGADYITSYYVAEFTKAGFPYFEAYVMALNWSQEKMVNGEAKLQEVYHERSDNAATAYKMFVQKEKTGGFQELMGLIASFDMAGYTAVKSLQKLKQRFPEKQKQIDAAMPFHGMTFWENLGIQSISWNNTRTSAFATADSATKEEMMGYLKKWMKEYPASISLLNDNGKGDVIGSLVGYLLRKNDKETLHNLLSNALLFEPGSVSAIRYALGSETVTESLLSFNDFEMIRQRYGITGKGAIERVIGQGFMKSHYDFITNYRWESGLFSDILKKYGESGDMEALNAYALLTYRGKTKDKKEDAYAMFKKVLDAGLPYPAYLVKEAEVLRKIGIDHWGRYRRELEYNHDFTPDARNFIEKDWGVIFPTYLGQHPPFPASRKLKIEKPGKPNETIYYYGDVENGMANGYGMGITPEDIKYIGYWKNNSYHGYGELNKATDGDLPFKGIFLQGKRNGYLVYGGNKFKKGHYLNDVFTSDKKYKDLQFTLPGRDAPVTYNGEVADGMANGFGIAKLGWLGNYEGFWKDNQFDGTGILKSGSEEYKGQFQQGKYHGWGLLTYKNGSTYAGDWKDGEMTGLGEWQGKVHFKGNFIKGIPQDPNAPKRNGTKATTASFKSLKEAAEKFDWTFLETPVNDEYLCRYFEEGSLRFVNYTASYVWTTTALNGQAVSNYTYEAVYNTSNEGGKEGEVGLIIELDENKGSGVTTKLMYLVKMGTGSFWLGTFNPATKAWTSFTNPDANNSWVSSAAIKTFGKDGRAINKLSLQKKGNSILIYANGQLLFTQKIIDTGKSFLQHFAGVGLVQANFAQGYISALSFKDETAER